MFKNSLFYLLFVIAVVGLTACLRADEDDSRTKTTSMTISFDVIPLEGETSDADTKSVIAVVDNSASIADFNIWIYNPDGTLRTGGYTGYHSSYSTDTKVRIGTLETGCRYYVRVLANVGEVAAPQTLSLCDAYTVDWDISAFNSVGAMPMSFKTEFTAEDVNDDITVHLERLFAKFTFGVDASAFAHGTFTVKSLALKNAPSCCTAFGPNAIGMTATAVDGDYATSGDLEAINGGFSKTFYLYENLQGNVLDGNTDSWKKEFDNYNQNKAAYKEKCSYLEVVGDYAGEDGLVSSNVTYKAYLGENATTSFDVTRNRANSVTLVLDEYNSLYKNGFWKLTPGTITDNRSINVPASLTIPALTTQNLSVTVSPANLQVNIETDASYASAKLTRDPAGVSFTGSKTISITSTEAFSEEKNTVLTFKTWDGRKSASTTLTVVDVIDRYGDPSGLSISCADVPASGGSVTSGSISGTCSQEVWYVSGAHKTLTDVPYTTSWSGGASGIASLGTTAKARSVVGDKLTLTYSANGKSGTAQVDVYQAENKVTGRETAGTGEDLKDYAVSIYDVSKSAGISAGGESVTFKVGASHQRSSWNKYKDIYSSGARGSVYDGEHSAYCAVNDDVVLSVSESWGSLDRSECSSGSTVTLTLDAHTGEARSLTVTAGNKNDLAKTATQSFSQNQGKTIVSTTTEWDYEDAGSRSYNGDYTVSISPVSKDVARSSGSFDITVTAGHTQYSQPQKKKRSKTKNIWSDDTVTYDNYSEWSAPYDDGTPTGTAKTDTAALSSDSDWLSATSTLCSYTENTGNTARSGKITASNGGTTAVLTVNQAGPDWEIVVEDN